MVLVATSIDKINSILKDWKKRFRSENFEPEVLEYSHIAPVLRRRAEIASSKNRSRYIAALFYDPDLDHGIIGMCVTFVENRRNCIIVYCCEEENELPKFLTDLTKSGKHPNFVILRNTGIKKIGEYLEETIKSADISDLHRRMNIPLLTKKASP